MKLLRRAHFTHTESLESLITNTGKTRVKLQIESTYRYPVEVN